MKRWIATTLFLCAVPMTAGGGAPRWAVYYSDKAPTKAFDDFDLLVFDADYHPPLEPLAERGKSLFGYISLGEVEEHRSHYAEVRNQGILLHENPNWKGSYFVDVRRPEWTRRVIEDIIPLILRQGFDGLFFDTLDNPGHLERTDPVRFKGMTEAGARLVRGIRRHFPTTRIMLNRGYDIIPSVEQHIDIILGESVFADYDFETGKYGLVDNETYRQQVEILQSAKARRPNLRVLTLDYWDPRDSRGIARIYRVQRANGFEPYVSTIELDLLVEEPLDE